MSDEFLKQNWSLILRGEFEQAHKVFSEALLVSPEKIENWSGLIACLCATGNIKNALAIIDQREQTYKDSDSSILLVMMGFASTGQERVLEFLAQHWP
ncbi:MAG: tetratricopeptide repeat protein, partial [Alphaproteobacteria bacterium]|nr:tetratricopeptide repeat protein [Alphaproteobacteria bacterium]